MKRIAFFVEGQTEQIFVNRLVRYLLGPKKTTIIQKKIKGGAKVPKLEMTIHRSEIRTPDFEVVIVNCGSDNRVKSEMLENIQNLESRNYQYIIGLRDLYPISLEELDKVEKGLKFLPNTYRVMSIVFDIVLAIKEIEAWFLAENNLFKNMHRGLTDEFVKKEMGYLPAEVNYKLYEHPASDLNKILQLVGLSYAKKYNQARKVVYSLNMYTIMHVLRYKIKELDRLISYIEKLKEK